MDTKKIVQLSLIGLLCASGAAYAEMIQGMIVRIDQANNLISIRQTGRIAKDTTEQLDVKFDDNIKTKNVQSVEELAVGQQVKVDIKKDKDANLMEAKSIEVTGAAPGTPSEMNAQLRSDLNAQPSATQDLSSDSAYGSNLTPRGQSPTPVSQGVPSAHESTSVTGHNAERGALPPGSTSDSGY